jgi:hypothetical protein
LLRLAQFRRDRGDNGFRDLVLDRENVFQHPVVALGPNLIAGAGIDQLRGDSDALSPFADGPVEHVAHAELLTHLFQVDRLALEDEAGITGDDHEPPVPREGRDDVFRNAVGKVFLIGFTAQIPERKHSDRRFVREWFRCGRWCRTTVSQIRVLPA